MVMVNFLVAPVVTFFIPICRFSSVQFTLEWSQRLPNTSALVGDILQIFSDHCSVKSLYETMFQPVKSWGMRLPQVLSL
jgi:hypothetical protein